MHGTVHVVYYSIYSNYRADIHKNKQHQIRTLYYQQATNEASNFSDISRFFISVVPSPTDQSLPMLKSVNWNCTDPGFPKQPARQEYTLVPLLVVTGDGVHVLASKKLTPRFQAMR